MAEDPCNATKCFLGTLKKDLFKCVTEVNAYIWMQTSPVGSKMVCTQRCRLSTDAVYVGYLDQSHLMQYVHAVVASVKEEDHPPYFHLLISL